MLIKIIGLFCLYFLIGVAISYLIFWHNRLDRKINRNQALSKIKRKVMCYALYLFDLSAALLLLFFFVYLLKESEFGGKYNNSINIFDIGGLISFLVAPILLRKKIFEKHYRKT